MNRAYTIFLSCVFFAGAALAADSSIVLMGAEGSFHGDETNLNDQDEVLVFGKIENNYFLKKNRISLELFADGLTDDESKGLKTGKKISLQYKNDSFSPIAILKSDLLREGKLETAIVPKKCLEKEVGGVCVISFKGKNYPITVNEKNIADSDTEEIFYNYDLTINDGISTSHMDGQNYRINSILWAGDMDGDGRLDMITDGGAHYNISVGYTLYLSSYAKEGEVFGVAGSIFGYGC